MDNTAVNLYRKVFGENYSAKSARQQSIDLETFLKIPQIVHDSLTQENFFNALKRYLKNFEKRGWKILSDVDESLQEKLSDYPSLEKFSASELNLPAQKIGYLVLCDGNSTKFDEIYNAVKNRFRFERYYLMYAVRAWTNELTANYYRPYLSAAKISLIITNAAWAYDHPLGNENPVTSEQIEERTKFSLKNVSENPSAYKNFLAKIYEGDEDFQRFFKVPPIVDVSPGLVRHADFSSSTVNISGGVRVTADVPDSYDNTIWIFGGCAIFGYAVDDKNTLPSMLQKYLNSEKTVTGGGRRWRVVNLGIWGGNFRDSHARLETLPLRAGDIVIVHYALGAVLQVENCRSTDISLAFRNSDIADDKFFDRVIHCGRYGYDLTARFLMNSIKDLLNCSPIDKNFAEKASIPLQSDLFKNFKEFIGDIKKNCAVDTNKSVGAVVMNCNPFTLGHLHLIEYAAAQVDFLYIFVVEEDKSIFPFKDRINLVRQGVSGIKNVYVTGSGKVMISTITFPTYFMKDNPATAALDTSFDVEIFARYVAPELNISYRFVGEEPFDAVTRNYNRRMKEILPQFGINVVEIPRKKFYDNGNEIIISASKVREYLKVKNFDALKKLLPAVTYEYLLSKSKEMAF